MGALGAAAAVMGVDPGDRDQKHEAHAMKGSGAASMSGSPAGGQSPTGVDGLTDAELRRGIAPRADRRRRATAATNEERESAEHAGHHCALPPRVEDAAGVLALSSSTKWSRNPGRLRRRTIVSSSRTVGAARTRVASATSLPLAHRADQVAEDADHRGRVDDHDAPASPLVGP